MKFGLWTTYGALNSPQVFEAFAAGAKKLGHSIVYNQEADIDVIWSILWNGRMSKNEFIYKTAVSKNKPILILEVGVIERGKTWKLGLNGVNRDAYFGDKNNSNDRAKKLNLQLKPWQNNQNGPIMIACQHKKSGQWKGKTTADNYLDKTIKDIRKHTNKEIIIRPHPRCPIQLPKNFKDIFIETPKKIKNTYDNYNINFNNLYCLFNYSSNPAVEAVMQGIPVFTSPSSLAYDVGNYSIKTLNNPDKPNREQWLNDLAFTEWTLEELKTGLPLLRLTSNL